MHRLAIADRARYAWTAFLDLEPVRLFLAEWLDGPYAEVTSGVRIPTSRLPGGGLLARIVTNAQGDVHATANQLVRLGDHAPVLASRRRHAIRVDAAAEQLVGPALGASLSERVQSLVLFDYLVRPTAFRDELAPRYMPHSGEVSLPVDRTAPLPAQAPVIDPDRTVALRPLRTA